MHGGRALDAACPEGQHSETMDSERKGGTQGHTQSSARQVGKLGLGTGSKRKRQRRSSKHLDAPPCLGADSDDDFQ